MTLFPKCSNCQIRNIWDFPLFQFFVNISKRQNVRYCLLSDDVRVVIRYRNSTENVDRTTTRAVRSVVVIHRVDELSIMEALGNAALLGREIINVVRSASC